MDQRIDCVHMVLDLPLRFGTGPHSTSDCALAHVMHILGLWSHAFVYRYTTYRNDLAICPALRRLFLLFAGTFSGGYVSRPF